MQFSFENASDSLPRGYQIVLVLQGGGALGAYQYGVYEALDLAKVYPRWVIGTSIGAINGGLIAGNPPEKRMDALKSFWDLMQGHGIKSVESFKKMYNMLTIMNGVDGFFKPNPPAWLNPNLIFGIEDAAYYKTDALKDTLTELIDLDYLNSKKTRLTVGAVNANTGEMRYFDNRKETLTIDHILASGALPPAFPAVRIDGQPYWDGGIFSNTPIEAVIEDHPRRNSLIFSVQLWNPQSDEPNSIQDVMSKTKDIQFASRDHFLDVEKKLHQLRHVIRQIHDLLPDDIAEDPEMLSLCGWGCGTTMHVVKLLAPRLAGEDSMKDIDFTSAGIGQRKQAGFDHTCKAFLTKPWSGPIDPIEGVLIHDIE